MPRIEGLTIEIGADAKKFQQEVRGMDKSLAKTRTSLSQVNRAMKFNPGNTDLIKQKQQLLGKSIDETKNKLTRLRQEEDRLKNSDGFDENSEDAQRLRREIIETESKLKSLNRQASQVSTVLGTKMQEAGKRMQGFGRSVSAVGDQLTTRVTLPLAAAGTVAAKKFAEVDKTMQLTNATMGNTEEEAKLINDAMKEAAANSTFGMNDAATASLNFARAGLDAAQASAALAPAMNLAAGEGGNLDTVSGGLVATINGFHGSFDEATHYADVFANACNNSALDVDSLSNAMSVAAPIFNAAGYKVDDAALYMGVMANNGIEASKAANSLKTGIARLIKPTDEASDWMTELGISMTNADGTMKDSVTVQKELHEAFGALSESEQIAAASAIFGKNQMAPWLALINTAPSDVSKLSGELKAEGTTADMAAKMMSGFGGSMEKLKSSIDVAATSLGQALAPTISKIADKIQSAVDAFNAMDEEQQQSIVKLGLMVAAAGPLLSIGGRLITGVGKFVTIGGKAINAIGAISKGTAAFSAGPAVAALAVTAGLVAGMYKMAKAGRDNIRAMHDLDEEQQKHVDALNSASEAYEEVDAARREATESAVSDAAYAHDLVDEYNGLVGSNGKIKKGYEDRANFVKGQLAEAMGVEESKIDELIGKNGQFKRSIEKLIETKKAEAILDANKDAYSKALQERKSAVEKLGPAMRDLQNKEKEYAAAQDLVAKRQREYDNYLASGGKNSAQYQTRLNQAKLAAEGAASAVDKQKKAIKGYEDTLKKANAEVKNYEGLATAIEKKDTAAIQKWSAALTTGIKTRENSTRKELQEQAKTINEEYKLIRQAYKNGDDGVTKQMVKDAKARRDAANKEAGITTRNAKKNATKVSKAEADGLKDGQSPVQAAAQRLRNTIKTNLQKAKGDAQSSAKGTKDTITSNLNGAKHNASSSLGGIANSAKSNMKTVKDSATDAASSVKGKFPISIGKLFSFALPKITATVKKVAGAVVPNFLLDWIPHAKNYTNPLLFTSPGLIGNHLFGDRGNAYGGEMVYGRNSLMNDITAAMERANTGAPVFNITIDGATDPRAFADQLVDQIQLRTRMI